MVTLKLGLSLCGESQPTRAGTNITGGRFRSRNNCLAVGWIGVALSQGATAMMLASATRSRNGFAPLTSKLDAQISFRLDVGAHFGAVRDRSCSSGIDHHRRWFKPAYGLLQQKTCF